MTTLLRRLLVVVAGAITFILIGTTAAWADCHASTGDTSGSGSETIGAGSQSWSWNRLIGEAYVSGNANNGMDLDKCLDTFVDWMTTSGHYDARIARNCKPGGGRAGTITEPSSWGGRTISGLQKAGACKYFQDASPPGYYQPTNPTLCGYDSESADEDGHVCYIGPAGTWTSKCGAYFIRHEDGTIDFNDGNQVQDCD